MKIACVKEIKNEEFRVGITPDAAAAYREAGHEVLIERGAGLGSFFPDADYARAGAVLLDDAEQVWAQADMMVKVKEPLPSEYGYFREDLILYTFLHLAAVPPLAEALVKSKVCGIAYETVVGRDGKGLPLLAPMSYVAGRLSVQEGASLLKRYMGGRGVLLGGVPGTKAGEVLVIGGGAAGAQAALMAVGLGARVTILESNPQRIEELNGMFGHSAQVVFSSSSALEEFLAKADLVISCVLIPGAKTPKLIRRAHLKTMKEGAVIVDVAIDQGGSTELSRPTTYDEPVFVEEGVILYCVANMPGAVPNTSTVALNNATLSYGLKIANRGFAEAVRAVPGLAPGVNTYRGHVTHRAVAEATGLPYRDLDALL